MIARHIPMKSPRRSSFRELVAYITHAQDKTVRIGEVRVTNCHQNTAADAVLEVLATQLQNQRACSDKTYHLLISFPAGETPSREVLRSIEDELCQALGLGEHQRVSAMHTDTDNLHIHVAINKIHPQTLTIHHPYGDYRALGAVCERLERVHGLVHTNHEAIAPGARSRALDMEHAAGVESLLGWIRRECLDDMRRAQSWDELHQCLGRNSLVLRERGNGFVVHDQEGRAVKASSIARELSMPQLVKRLGPFEPGGQQEVEAACRYQVRPVAQEAGTDALYRRYLAERARRQGARAQMRTEMREQKHFLVAQAKERARVKRGLIQALDCGRLMKRMLHQQAHSTLRADLQSIHAGQKAVQAAQAAKFPHARNPSWLDWLAEQAAGNDQEALAALRRRQSRALRCANGLLGAQARVGQGRGLHGGEGSGVGLAGHGQEGLKIDHVTRQGTIVYANGQSAIRDRGGRLEISQAIRQSDLEVALSLAVQRFGRQLTIEGDAAFRKRVISTARALRLDIRFDGAAEEVRQQQADSQPACGGAEEAAEAGEAAARRYIAERESKRGDIPGIPRHVLGEAGALDESMRLGGGLRYAGWRKVDGHCLLLAETAVGEIAVIPVDASTLARAARLQRGQVLHPDGRERDQGRGRNQARGRRL